MGDEFHNIHNSQINNRSTITRPLDTTTPESGEAKGLAAELKTLVTENKLKECLRQLTEVLQMRRDKEGLNDVVLLSSKLHELEQRLALGLLGEDPYQQSRGKVVQGLLLVIDRYVEE